MSDILQELEKLQSRRKPTTETEDPHKNPHAGTQSHSGSREGIDNPAAETLDSITSEDWEAIMQDLGLHNCSMCNASLVADFPTVLQVKRAFSSIQKLLDKFIKPTAVERSRQ